MNRGLRSSNGEAVIGFIMLIDLPVSCSVEICMPASSKRNTKVTLAPYLGSFHIHEVH